MEGTSSGEPVRSTVPPGAARSIYCAVWTGTSVTAVTVWTTLNFRRLPTMEARPGEVRNPSPRAVARGMSPEPLWQPKGS